MEQLKFENIVKKYINNFNFLTFDITSGVTVDKTTVGRLQKCLEKEIKKDEGELYLFTSQLEDIYFPIIVVDLYQDLTNLINRIFFIPGLKITSWDELFNLGLYFREANQFEFFQRLVEDGYIFQKKVKDIVINFTETDLGLGLSVYTKNGKVLYPKK